MILHTVNKSPFERNSFSSCLMHALPGSGVLLLEDGVYAALQGTAASEAVTAAAKQVKLYALGPDLDARGISAKVMDCINVVDYTGFVKLVEKHDRVQAWL